MVRNCTQRLVDCKTVGFFLKISKEISKAWRKSLVRDLLFDYSRVLEYAKIRTVLQSKRLVTILFTWENLLVHGLGK